MQFILSTLVLLATSALAAPAPQASSEPSWKTIEWTPGMAIPKVCKTSPTHNACPARLKSGNALVTARNVVLNSLLGANHESHNNFRSGWSHDDTYKRYVEETTLSLFDFPAGYQNKQCKFQFVTDGGDLVPAPMLHMVWALVNGTGNLGLDTTYDSKPSRDKVVAMFAADEALARKHATANEKWMHQFVFGPGEGTPKRYGNATFPCPPGGKVGYEVASIKALPVGGVINAGGNNGLGIEIIGVKSGW
ncbi:hypothetical protein FN846DRAFT_968523 [Sphaerosporella brunnea]|uniref:Ubiquitin 3 binding protein But2 C-terminal domain-containing protein n=1 Tax=Sphaerosporella brunnea TaxID=1250544 RepID=A0A5J5EJT2_9PEZI|nr:hypothetical protein FN846DRAFT_968523 [Sphaerosporella brunnea]